MLKLVFGQSPKPDLFELPDRPILEFSLGLLPIGKPQDWVLKGMADLLQQSLTPQVIILERIPLPGKCYNSQRDQYLAEAFLDIVRSTNRQYELDRTLGVTDVDLYTPGLNFIFGQAMIHAGAAVISLARLVSMDKNLFIGRALKESVHELGHTFGLTHCLNTYCIMHFSNCLLDTDKKGPWYCKNCELKLIKAANKLK